MLNKSRTQNVIINVVTGSAMQAINIVLGFISRTIFINLLNADYLGVNSLYSNVLTVLSFAELGIGSAIVFSLYKPIAEDDKNKIQVLMKFYKVAYRLIGLSIFVLGLFIIPFMDYIIKETPKVSEDLILIYFLFLVDTSSSYFFGYKKTLITASQKDYIVQIYARIFQLIKILASTLFLFFNHKYLGYLIIQIICTVLLNVVLSCKADELYPFLRERNKSTLARDEKKSIYENVKALFIYKFGSVVLNGTDSIIISALINVSTVGLASNYTMLINNATNVIGGAINSLTASVGNLSVNGTKEQIKEVMNELLLICVWLYGFVVIGFATLVNDFVLFWLGNDYVLNQLVVYAVLFSIYINGVQYAAYTFRTTQGLFKQSRWIPLLSAVINVVLSILWGKRIGLIGIFAATGVSRLITTTVVDPWLVYKHNFGEKPFEYYARYTVETLAVVFNLMLHLLFMPLITIRGWGGFIVKFLIVCITSNLIFFVEFCWTKEFKDIKKRLKPLIVKCLKRIHFVR